MVCRSFLSCLVASVVVLTGCSPDTAAHRPVVRDEAGLLTPEDRAALEAVHFPPGVRALVHTTATLPLTPGLPAAAGEVLEAHPPWSPSDAPGLVDRVLGWSSAKVVFVLVSGQPRMLQVRHGRELAIPALREGVLAGPTYRRWQDDYARAADAAPLRAAFAELAQALGRGLEAPWYRSWLDRGEIGGFVVDTLEPLLAPGNGLFTRLVLAPVASVVSRLVRALAALGPVAAVGGTALVVVGFELLVRWPLRRLTRGPGRRLGFRLLKLGVGSGLVLVGLAVSGTLLLLASGRWEDERALELMGAVAVPELVRTFSTLAAPSPWWVALLTAVVMAIYLHGHLELAASDALASLPDEAQREMLAAASERQRRQFDAERRVGFFKEAMGGDADDVSAEEYARHPFTVIAALRHGVFKKGVLQWGLGLLVLPGVFAVYVLVGTCLRAVFAVPKGLRAAEATRWISERESEGGDAPAE